MERWITPSLFDGLQAQDETSFCLETGSAKKEKLRSHRESFITEDDFKWLAKKRLNAVRIPVPHWIFGDQEPYVGAIDTLDSAFGLAGKYNLKVIIDIHTAPGSQNGQDHSGKTGKIEWHRDDRNIEKSLDFVLKLSERYNDRANLWGIELLNEPHGRIPKRILKDYYLNAYKIVREICGEQVRVIISDGFNPYIWHSFMAGLSFKNTITDTHLYQCFNRKDKKLDLVGHLHKAKKEWSQQIAKIREQKPVIVGEWSLGLDPATFAGVDENDKKAALKKYANAQLLAFQEADGWFFWNYKTEDMPGWNFRLCVETGLLPEKF